MVRNLNELGINLQQIIKRLQANQNLLKLLYYTDKDPLSHDDFTEEQIKNEIYEKLIKIVPRVGEKETANSVVALRITNAERNDNNEFKNINFALEIFVPLSQWIIKNSNLRPFAIMSEIENSIKNKRIDGLGKIMGDGFSLGYLTNEISCYEMPFSITIYD